MRHAILLLVLSAACGTTTETASDEALGRVLVEDGANSTVVREYFSGITQATDLLITSNDEWARIWAAIYSGRSPVPERPAVDFTREALVLSALGSSNGVNNLIEGVRLFERGVVVRVIRSRYDERCLVLTAIGQPVHVVRIQKPEGRVVRVESRDSVISCD